LLFAKSVHQGAVQPHFFPYFTQRGLLPGLPRLHVSFWQTAVTTLVANDHIVNIVFPAGIYHAAAGYLVFHSKA
jgi:hypothetical protein